MMPYKPITEDEMARWERISMDLATSNGFVVLAGAVRRLIYEVRRLRK